MNILKPTSDSTAKALFVENKFSIDELQRHMDTFDPELYRVVNEYILRNGEQHYDFKVREGLERQSLINESLFERLHVLLHQPFMTWPGIVLSILTMLLIILSCITATMETLPQYSTLVFPSYATTWDSIEIFVTVFFTVELVLLFATSKNKGKFFVSFYNLMDVVAVLPLYLNLIAGKELSFLRIFRIARVFKFSRAVPAINHLLQTLRSSVFALVAPFAFLCTTVIFMSSIMYAAEGGTWVPENGTFLVPDCSCERKISDPSEIKKCTRIPASMTSIPHAMWWAATTMTGVGGEIYPACLIGQAIASVTLVMGTFYIAVPVAIVGSYFTTVQDTQRKVMFDQKVLRRRGGANVELMNIISKQKSSPAEMLMKYLRNRLGVGEVSTVNPSKDFLRAIDDVFTIGCPECCETCRMSNGAAIKTTPLTLYLESSDKTTTTTTNAPAIVPLPTTAVEFHIGSKCTLLPDPDMPLPPVESIARVAILTKHVPSGRIHLRPSSWADVVVVNGKRIPIEGVELAVGDVVSFQDKDQAIRYVVEA